MYDIDQNCTFFFAGQVSAITNKKKLKPTALLDYTLDRTLNDVNAPLSLHFFSKKKERKNNQP